MLSVWMIPVFAYCIWVGKQFSKRCKGCFWATFLFFPTIFMLTAFFTLLIHGHSLAHWTVYLMSLWVGGLVGLLITNPVPIKIDLVRQTIAAPGSWLLFICLMVLCVLKCAFDVVSVLMPAYLLDLIFIGFGIKGIVTGLLYGQALSFLYRFSIADTCAPHELVRGRFVFFCGMQRVAHARDTGGFPLSSAA